MNVDPFDEHDQIDKEMKALQQELQGLCIQGNYEEATRRAKVELVPLHKRWIKSLIKSFDNLKKNPNFYQPKK